MQTSQISRSSFLCFLAVGGSATLIHYMIMMMLTFLANTKVGIASATGYVLSTFYNYWANSFFTFGGGHNHARSLPRFLIIACVGLILNQIILLLMIHFLLPTAIAQLIATTTVLLWNYFINAAWTFAKR